VYCPGTYDNPINYYKVPTCAEETKVINPSLFTIEVLVDIIWIFEIMFNFVKRTHINTDVASIGKIYI